MKLHEFKALFMSKLSLLEVESKREKELRDILMTKLNNLRMMNLPNLTHTLYLILEYEDVSDRFKSICREMLRHVEKLDFTEQ